MASRFTSRRWPESCGRHRMDHFNLANEGWNELKAKAGAEVDQPTYMQQFACHAIYAPSASGIFGGNTTWDLEGFRGTNSDPVSIGGVANHQCNWRPGT
ncbi:DUF2599 domain-containing protein [Paenarthrobacter sp. YJN-D]|uniref:DUF2599 domain-containing protein n=1 Tax=Paenarthrobacter sp. YJN-D TaxID=2735317 RepID=UPI001D0CD8C4